MVLGRSKLEENIRIGIQDRINRILKSNDRINERKRSGKKQFGDSISLRANAKDLEKLSALLDSFNKLCSFPSNHAKVSKDISERLGTILSRISLEDAIEMKKAYLKCFSQTNSNQKDAIKKQASIVQSLLKKNGLTGKIVFDQDRQYSYKGAIEELENRLVDRLVVPVEALPIKKEPKSSVPSSEERLIDNLQRMVAEGKIEKDRNVQNILSHIGEIKTTYQIQKDLSRINLEINNVIALLKESLVDFSILEDFLQKLVKENTKKIVKCDMILSKFDFTKVKASVKKQEEEEEIKRKQEFFLQEYRALAYDLEEALTEGKSIAEKDAIQAKMREVSRKAVLVGVSQDALRAALSEGKVGYRDDKYRRDTLTQKLQEEISDKDELNKEMNRALREIAIRELELAGAFEEDYEWRGGDAYSTLTNEKIEKMIRTKMQEISIRLPKDDEYEKVRQEVQMRDRLIAEERKELHKAAIEALVSNTSYRNLSDEEKEIAIQEEMREMASYAKMSPEQRGLTDFKESGYISQDTTLQDLRPQQLADFRVVYHDTMEDKRIRESQNVIDSQRKSQANTIYKQYIRYYASLDDKALALKFSEYARILYEQENMDDSLVDEEVKGKCI